MNYEAQGEVLGNAKKRQQEYIEEINQKDKKIIELQNSLSAIRNTRGIVDDLKSEVEELRTQKRELEDKFEKMVSAPFFNPDAGESAQRRVEKLEIEIETVKKFNREYKERIMSLEGEKDKTKQSLEEVSEEKAKIETELKDMKNKYQASGIEEIDEITEKLFRLDPSAFRQTMKDLQFTGDEPTWAKTDFMTKKGEMDVPAMIREIERLRRVNRDISAEFDKAKNMVQLQHDLETDNLRLHKEQAEQLSLQVKALNTKLDEMNRLVDRKNKQI